MMLLAVLLGLLLLVTPSWAQQSVPGTLVQQSPTTLDSCNAVASSVQAVNTATAATVTVPGGAYAYLCAIEFSVCTNGTGTAQNQVTFTSSGIVGTPSWQYSIAATASICSRWTATFGGSPLRSATPGTNVVITPPVAATNNSYGILIYYYVAP